MVGICQITLRKLPETLDKQLRSLAEKNGTSLNKTIISLLMKSFGLSVKSKRKRDLTGLCGTLNDKQLNEFQKNIEIFNQIDQEMWE